MVLGYKKQKRKKAAPPAHGAGGNKVRDGSCAAAYVAFSLSTRLTSAGTISKSGASVALFARAVAFLVEAVACFLGNVPSFLLFLFVYYYIMCIFFQVNFFKFFIFNTANQ